MINDSSDKEEALEELTEGLSEVAGLLAGLSSYDDLPGVVTRAFRPREIDEILEGNVTTWLATLIHEQDWLNLDSEIPLAIFESNPMSAARQIFVNMGMSVNDASDCLVLSEFGPNLTNRGIAVLTRRLEVADKCAERCRSLTNSEKCKEEWEAAWNDDEQQISTEQEEEISADSLTWSISEFIGKQKTSRLVLNPTYQRDDVWKNKDSSALIESIFRGIPLPSIVMLEVGKPRSYEIVDGKQRISSILRFVGCHPYALKKAEELDKKYTTDGKVPGFVQALNTDYRKFIALWKANENQKLTSQVELEFMLPFKVKGLHLERIEQLKHCVGKYYTDILAETLPNGHSVKHVFEETVSYKLPVIIFTDATPKQIHDVFHLYNRQGKHLNAEEVRNAVYHELLLNRAILGSGQINHDVDELLKDYSPKLRGVVKSIAQRLDENNVPSDRYRRTKLFGWVLASIFALEVKDGAFRILSTAKQIDEMLSNATKTSGTSGIRALRQLETLEEIFDALDDAVRVIDQEELFCIQFRGTNSGRWQDLQFVSALAALLIARITLGREFDDRIALRKSEVDVASKKLTRPEKAQSRTQWEFIGRAIHSFLVALDISDSCITDSFQKQFKHDPMIALNLARNLGGKVS